MEPVASEVASIARAVHGVLERVRAAQAGDAEAAQAVRAAIVEVGRGAQALEGMLLALVGAGDRLGIARGGIGPWLATVLDVTEGRARSLAHDARLLARVERFEAELCSGGIGPDSARALARTVKAVRATGLDAAGEVAETLRVTRAHGARAGLERARALEERIEPGSIEARHAQARERSFARISAGEDGMHRCEILLDPLRGAVLQAAVDLQVAEMIRTRQFDGAQAVAQDVRSTEQMNAEAVTRLAQVFLDAPAHQRAAHFSLPALAVSVQDPAGHGDVPAGWGDVPAGCARTVYGALIPARLLPRPGDPRRRELRIGRGGATLDGTDIDHAPGARLASPRQRAYLAWRDRHCAFPGCDRPVTFALHAHHLTPYAHGRRTEVDNLRLYCAPHHTTVHHG